MNSKIALQTIVRKEVIRWSRIWRQTLLPSAITMTLYFIIFGTFIGSQVKDINGYTYMQFILPGLIMMAVINNSYSNVSSSFFGSKFGRSVQELLVSPVPSSIIIAGYTIGSILRAIIVGILVMLVGLFFVPLVVNSWLLVWLFVILSSLVFSLAGLLNGIFANKFDDIAIIPTFVLTPLTYLGGVFYSISSLPEIWQTISKFNPILYMVNGFRYGFLGVSDVSLFSGISILLIFIIVLYSVCWVLLEKGYRLRT